MGWRAFTKEGEETREETHGRPVQAGEEGNLLAIAQEDFGHKICIDLQNGVILLDYENLGVQNGSLEIEGQKYVLFICDDTNIGADMVHRERTKVDAQGWFSEEEVPLVWRPIWFTRYTNGIPTKVIGAQTTLPEEFGGHNIKKMIMLYADGRIGIY